ncbi:metal ion permease [Photobacterium aquimaris]|uniref:Metal ion permease n=1 Tax=Photobacterium aquimaris TaxID=512643 RepID=A0A2T3IJF8_9GAMM|nr:permease [Photobacterium aquimaris]OBU16499.1 metal ion permease [Photobacterium aquimaris]OBU17372.1 metal ion permease [Photobacterium aquimaris]PSU28489.1 metal ion permease [Photobacterium aquimaris]PSW02701.1 metal ion permease [Photobacterium aquimaris]
MIGHDISGLVIHVFSTFGNMIWQIFWPLAFGLILSSWIRNLIPVSSVVKHLGKTTPVSLGFTTFLGMVSSSCSYAAASLSHTLLVKKSTVANAMAFLVSSTNLIVEMFIVLVALMGWTFLWGEVIGGLILIATVGFLFSRFFPKDVEQELRQHLEDAQPQKASCGMDMSKMKSDDSDCGMDMSKMKPEHSDCGMDMAAKPQSPLMEKITKSAGFFQMDIAMIGKEILIGVVVSSILIALMPQEGWRALFISNDAGLPVWLHSFLDVIIGIFVAMIAYVCSVGNLILAAALWHGGISFGGVIGFILSDVLTIPMIRVYQKYYGKRPAKWMVGLLFVAILFTGLCVDAIFNGFGWVTSDQTVRALNQSGFGFNMTTVMNLIFIPASIWYYYLGKKANAGMGMSM